MHLFHNIRFPLEVSLGARGGPQRRTDILALASGSEHRNSPHRHSRRRYDAGVGVKSLADMDTLIAFFESRGGQLHSFRFRDPLDHNGALTLQGDGARIRFALHKLYGDGAALYRRPLHAVEDVTVVPPQPFAVEGTDVVFDTAPDGPVAVSFTFDTIVRFDTDRLDIALEDFGAGQVVSLPLVEVLAHEVAP